MTEAEARRKWCPLRPPASCIASDCIAWRKQTMVRDKETGEVFPDGGGIVYSWGYEIVEGHGYCGLAGKP